MSYFETEHERNSAKITALITIIIMLLLFVVGPKYMDPPEEYGVAVNFGTSNVGSGDIQPKQPVKSQVNDVTENEEPQQETQTESSESAPKAEDVITEDSEETIAIKKQKEAEAKAKAEAERLEREKREAEERKRLEEERKKKALDALIGGVKNAEGKTTGSEGNDNQAGDKGQLDGDPYAPSYFGGAGPGKGGIGYGLNGRGKPTGGDIFKQDCNEYGLVVVEIEVDRSGRVVKAIPGVKKTTNTAPCLLEPAKKIALSYKWPADPNAPVIQKGYVVINFDLK